MTRKSDHRRGSSDDDVILIEHPPVRFRVVSDVENPRSQHHDIELPPPTARPPGMMDVDPEDVPTQLDGSSVDQMESEENVDADDIDTFLPSQINSQLTIKDEEDEIETCSSRDLLASPHKGLREPSSIQSEEFDLSPYHFEPTVHAMTPASASRNSAAVAATAAAVAAAEPTAPSAVSYDDAFGSYTSSMEAYVRDVEDKHVYCGSKKDPVVTPSPSTLAQYFSFDCERFLSLSRMAEPQRAVALGAGTDETPAEKAMRRAMCDRGDSFEEKLKGMLKRHQSLKFVDLTGASSHKVLETLRILSPGTVLYQMPLKLQGGGGSDFVTQMERRGCKLSDASPDFIFVDVREGDESCLDMIVVDAKSSRSVKFGHQIQVAYYGILLSAYLDENKSNIMRTLCVSSEGGVWLPDGGGSTWIGHREQWMLHGAPDLEDISLVRDRLEAFLLEELPDMLRRELNDASWLLRDNCRTCPYVASCKQKAVQENLVVQIPYLRQSDVVWMQQLLPEHAKSGRPASTLPLTDVEDLLQPQNYRGGPRLTGSQETRLRLAIGAEAAVDQDSQDIKHMPNVSAYSLAVSQGGAVVRADRNSMHFPSGEDFRVMLSIHCNPASVTPCAYAWGILVNRSAEAEAAGLEYPSGLNAAPIVHITERGLDFDQELAAFKDSHAKLIAALHQVLGAFSSEKETGRELPRVCIFFYDGLEQTQLESIILSECLTSNEPYKAAMECALSLIQGGSALSLNVVGDHMGGGSGGESGGQITKYAKITTAKMKKAELVQKIRTELPPGRLRRLRARLEELTVTQLKEVVTLENMRRAAGLEEDAATPDIQAAFSEVSKRQQEKREEKERRASQLIYPRVGLIRDTIKRHLTLPVAGFYDYESLCRCLLVSSGAPIKHEDVYGCWQELRESEVQRSTASVICDRMKQLTMLVDRFRAVLREGATQLPISIRPRLMYEGGHLSMVKSLGITSPVLSKMAFIVQHESLVSCAEMRRNRALKPIQEQLAEGSKAIKLVCCGDEPERAFKKMDDGKPMLTPVRQVNSELTKKRLCTFTLHDDSRHVSVHPDKSNYFEWLLVEACASGRLAAARFEDMLHRSDMDYPGLANISSVECGKITLMMNQPWPGSADKGKKYLLFKRYIDVGLVKMILDELRRLEKSVVWARDSCRHWEPLFLRIIKVPGRWNHGENDPLPLSPSLQENRAESIRDCLSNFDLRDSQRKALLGSLSRHLTTVWGPPGAGKTHFIATLVATLVLLRKGYVHPNRENSLCVLITSYTNSAIATCLGEIGARLNKLREKSLATMPNEGPLATIVKLTKEGETVKEWMKDAGVQLLKGKDLHSEYLKEHPICIVGCTPWKLAGCKFAKERVAGSNADLCPFDVVIIDEGSQMPTPNASLAVRFLDPDGMLVVAGDVLQLPPIIKGVYPAPARGEPRLYGSILECLLRDTSPHVTLMPFSAQSGGGGGEARAPPYAEKLKENFRMNDSLARFTHFTYGRDYESQDPRRSLKLDAEKVNRVHLQALSPEDGVIFGAICATASLNIVHLRPRPVERIFSLTKEDMAAAEAQCVCKALLLFQRVVEAEQDPADIGKDVIVVTPHHVQRRAVRRCLEDCELLGRENILVDTAEKAQGKTADLIIVCYGILSEAELEKDTPFLFSHSRLNVALSRARCKIIIFVGEPMSSMPLRCLGDREAQKGYSLFEKALRHSRHEGGIHCLSVDLP